MMQSLFDAYGGGELAVCDAYAEAERPGKVDRPEEDCGEFAESYARSLSSGVRKRIAASIEQPGPHARPKA